MSHQRDRELPGAKLNQDLIDWVRATNCPGVKGQGVRALARKLGVNEATVCAVVKEEVARKRAVREAGRHRAARAGAASPVRTAERSPASGAQLIVDLFDL
jgi:hypothetical protein